MLHEGTSVSTGCTNMAGTCRDIASKLTEAKSSFYYLSVASDQSYTVPRYIVTERRHIHVHTYMYINYMVVANGEWYGHMNEY